MNKVLLLLSLVLFQSWMLAQPNSVEWATIHSIAITNTGTESNAHVAANAGGEVVMSRLTTRRYFDGINAYGTVTIQQATSDGLIVWEATMSDSARIHQIIYTDDRIFIEGEMLSDLFYENSLMLTYDDGTFSGNNLFSICLNDDGEVLWARNLSTGQPMVGNQLAGAIHVAPSLRSWHAFTDYSSGTLLCLDQNGNALDTLHIANIQTLGGVAQGNNGVVYCSGACFNNEVVIGNSTFTAPNAYNAFVAAISPEGNGLWMHFFEDITIQFPSLSMDAQERLYFVYGLFGTIDVDGQLLEANGGADLALICLDGNGAITWAKDVQSTGAVCSINLPYHLALEPAESGTFLTLMASGAGTMDTWSFQTEGNANIDAAILHIDQNGDVAWYHNFTGSWYEEVHDIAPHSDHCYFAVSGFNGLDVSPFSLPIQEGQYLVYGKLASSVFVDETAEERIYPFPNPTNGLVSWSRNWKGQLTLYDITGKLVHTQTPDFGNRLPASLSTGLYFWTIDDQNKRQTGQLIISKP